MKVWASEVADFLGLSLVGSDIILTGPCSINAIQAGGLSFASKMSDQLVERLNQYETILVIASPEYEGKLIASHVISNHPRLDYARGVQRFFVEKKPSRIEADSIIGHNVTIGNNVSIGHYCVIEDNVTIGDNTVINHHVVLMEGVTIGRNCLLKSNCVIGEVGFGYELDEQGVPLRLPHLGSVVLGDNVEIGSYSAVERGTIDHALIEDNVKIAGMVGIGHNVHIEENCLVLPCAIGGSVHIKKNTFIGLNATIRNGTVVGENVVVGAGSNVIGSVEDNVVVAGNPARVINRK